MYRKKLTLCYNLFGFEQISTLCNVNHYSQHVEWDLDKTSKTLTETLTALFLMV